MNGDDSHDFDSHDLSPDGSYSRPSSQADKRADTHTGAGDAGNHPLLFALRVLNQLNVPESYHGMLNELGQYLQHGLSEQMVAFCLINQASIFVMQERQIQLEHKLEELKAFMEKVSSNIDAAPTVTDSQKEQIIDAVKLVTFRGQRVNYDNNTIVADTFKYIEKHRNEFSLAADCFTTTSKSSKALKKEIRSKTSYAKTRMLNTYSKTLFEKPVGVTAAVAQVAKVMTGSSENVKTQETIQGLLIRHFLRRYKANPDDFAKRKPSKNSATNSSNKRRRTSDNFLGVQNEDGTGEEVSADETTVLAFWAAFTEWYNDMIEGSEKEGRKGLGDNLMSREWHEFFESCMNNKMVNFPQDKIDKIPRQASAPIQPVNTSTTAVTGPRSRSTSFFSTPSPSPSSGGLLFNSVAGMGQRGSSASKTGSSGASSFVIPRTRTPPSSNLSLLPYPQPIASPTARVPGWTGFDIRNTTNSESRDSFSPNLPAFPNFGNVPGSGINFESRSDSPSSGSMGPTSLFDDSSSFRSGQRVAAHSEPPRSRSVPSPMLGATGAQTMENHRARIQPTGDRYSPSGEGQTQNRQRMELSALVHRGPPTETSN